MLFKNRTKLTYSSRNAVLVSLVIVGIIAVYNWIVEPHRNYLLAAQRYESTTTDFAKKRRVINNNTLTIKKKKLKELQEQLEQFHTRLFNPTEARRFLSNIQTVVENANCTVNLLKSSPSGSALKAEKSEKNSYIITTQRVKLSVTGNYGNITLLMNKLQGRSKQVRIDSVSIRQARNNSSKLKCDMDITIYMMRNQEETA